MTFKQMNISEPVCRALLEKNYSTPTLIQEQAIPEALTGRDLLGLAQTGTGKTAAFAIPIIEQLLADPTSQQKGAPRKIRALILTPTRELAIQIDESLADYTRYTTLRHTVIFGGVKQKSQTDELRAGTDILTATPGRLLDLMSQGFIRLDHVRHFVLDEADRMLDMGFIHDVKRLLPKDNIARYLSRRGITCESIHGDKSQNSRQRALSNFKEGRSNVIIATDIAARGIDIKGLDLVLNYDLPDVPETYVHRIGRTGRAGCEGRAIAFCSGEEVPMLREIEKLTGIKLEQRKHDLPSLEETKTAPVVNVARKVQAKAPADKQQGKQNNKRREGRKPAEPLKNTQQATVVAEKPKRHNRPAKPILARESQQKQSADKTEQASSRSAKLRSRYENYE